MGDKNFIYNSGSFVPFLLIQFVYTLVCWLLHYIATKNFQNKYWRKIGVNLYDKNRGTTLFYAVQKLFLECFLDLYLALVLHLSGFILDTGDNGFIESFFTDAGDIVCTVIVIVLMTVATVYPFLCHYIIKHNFKNLKSSRVAAKYRVILEGNKIGTLNKSLCTVYFLYRRLITATVLVVLSDYPYFQMVFLIFLSLGSLAYYVGSRPLKEGLWLEFINEICIYFC
jgi:magnesium-transporting ATPase (P-type)